MRFRDALRGQPLAERVLPALAAEGFVTTSDWAVLDASMEALTLSKLRDDAGLKLAELARWKKVLREVTDAAETADEPTAPEDDDEPMVAPPANGALPVMRFLATQVRRKPMLIFHFSPLGYSLFFGGDFVAGLALAKEECGELQQSLMTLFNNNVLITSLMAGAACGLTGVTIEWCPLDDDSLGCSQLLVGAVEFNVVLVTITCLCSSLLNVIVSTVVQSVPLDNLRFWVKANTLALTLAQLSVVVGCYLFVIALLLAGAGVTPFPRTYLAAVLTCFFVWRSLLEYVGTIMPLLTFASGALSNRSLMPAAMSHHIPPDRARAVMLARAQACPSGFVSLYDDKPRKANASTGAAAVDPSPWAWHGSIDQSSPLAA